LPRRQALPETIEDLPFTRRQVVLVSADEARLPRTVAELFDQPRRQRPGERGLPVEDVSERRSEPVRAHVLEEVAGGADLERGEQILAFLALTDHHDLRLRQLRVDFLSSGDPTAGHVDVEQADI